MPGFVKIYGDRLLRSTLWVDAAPATKVVWITMLALADQHGHVQGSTPGLANAAGVSLDETACALDYLRAPDPHSQTKDHKGRRVEDLDEGGWIILNYVKYREFRTEAQVKEATRKQEWRKKKARAGRVPNVPPSPTVSCTDADADADTTPPPRAPAAAAAAGKNTWMTPFMELHLKILEGKMNASRWVRVFRPLFDEHGEAEVLGVQRHYLENLKATGRQDFLDYNKMAESFGTWLAPQQKAGRPTRRIGGKDFNA